ncbi:MAG: hypothetical protein V4805_12335 [Pseudomonadota bacterium]
MKNTFLQFPFFLILGAMAHNTAYGANASATPEPTVAVKPAATAESMMARRLARRIKPLETLALKNPSFTPDEQGNMTDWVATEHADGKSYTFVADAVKARSAPASARLQQYGPEPFGLLRQSIQIHPLWHNKIVRLSGFLRTDNANGRGGAFVLRTDGGSGEILAWNMMEKSRVTGTQDWKPYSIDLKITPDATSLMVGIMLEDGGTLWADDLSIKLLDSADEPSK